MHHQLDKETPKFDVQLLFDEIGVLLDNHQYRDVISLVDMYHFYTRQHQYRKYRPSAEDLEANKPRALLRFAGKAILDEVRERRYRWTWPYFAKRRDNRHQYVDLFKQKLLETINPNVRLNGSPGISHQPPPHRVQTSLRLWRRRCHTKTLDFIDLSHAAKRVKTLSPKRS